MKINENRFEILDIENLHRIQPKVKEGVGCIINAYVERDAAEIVILEKAELNDSAEISANAPPAIIRAAIYPIELGYISHCTISKRNISPFKETFLRQLGQPTNLTLEYYLGIHALKYLEGKLLYSEKEAFQRGLTYLHDRLIYLNENCSLQKGIKEQTKWIFNQIKEFPEMKKARFDLEEAFNLVVKTICNVKEDRPEMSTKNNFKKQHPKFYSPRFKYS